MTSFPLQEFLAFFPEFDTEDEDRLVKLQSYGMRAHMHISTYERCVCDLAGSGFGLNHDQSQYALFLMTVHLLTIADKASTTPDGSGSSTGLSGVPFKATVGSVTVETSKQNAFKLNDWNWWLGQTEAGRELLAFLEMHSVPIYLNTPQDSVRDLL